MVPQTVQEVHIAMLTALAAFDAAMPGVPNVVHDTLLLLFSQEGLLRTLLQPVGWL